MCFIVIETFGGAEYAAIATDQDGNNLVFDRREDAEAEAADCQAAVVIELQAGIQLMVLSLERGFLGVNFR